MASGDEDVTLPETTVPHRLHRRLLLGVLVLLAVVVVRAAWLSDDAFVTLRTIDNFWQGYGLRWNIVERVQAYSHPLWMMLLGSAYGVTREAYFTTLAVSAACLVASVWLLVKYLPAREAGLAVLLLAVSQAFVDFSSSGLENPLSHLLLIAFSLVLMEEAPSPSRFRTLAWLASLCALTRLELALIVAPAMVGEAWRLGPRRAAPPAMLAAVPLLAWHAFTLVYYGSLVPNTYLAKAHTGLPRIELIAQGLRYLQESVRGDYVTLPLVIIGLLAAWGAGARGRWLGLGMLLSVASVVWVGGDFMTGRFLTPVFVCGVVLTARAIRQPRPAVVVALALVAVSLLSPRSSLRVWVPDPAFGDPIEGFQGILSERQAYYAHTGLLRVLAGRVRPEAHPWAVQGTAWSGQPQVVVYEAIGLLGFHAGPAPHLVDPMALSDAFLARLPATTPWRIGHFRRAVPDGYEAGLEECVSRLYPDRVFAPPRGSCADFMDVINHVEDPQLRMLWRDVIRVTEGPLLTRARWRALARLHGW